MLQRVESSYFEGIQDLIEKATFLAENVCFQKSSGNFQEK